MTLIRPFLLPTCLSAVTANLAILDPITLNQDIGVLDSIRADAIEDVVVNEQDLGHLLGFRCHPGRHCTNCRMAMGTHLHHHIAFILDASG